MSALLRHFTIAAALLIACSAGSARAGKPPAATVTATIDPQSLAAGQGATIQLVTEIPPGLHSHSNKPSKSNFIPFVVAMEPSPIAEFSPPNYPPGENHEYPALGGTLNIYTGRVTVTVSVRVKPDAPAGPAKLNGKVSLQMCDENLCYPPAAVKFAIDVTIAGAATTTAASTAPTTPVPTTTAPATTTPAVASTPKMIDAGEKWSLAYAFGVALVAGLLFNIMPCVLPVLPLKAVGFYEASQHNRARSVALGLVFSAGLISVFALLAMVVLVFRFITWGELFTKGWFIWFIIVPLLTTMGFGLLGGWDFSLPLGVYRFEPRHDTFGGNFFWGALTAILATPCTAPLLPPLLIWASAQPGYVGVPSIIMVGVGMALPYLLLSAMPEVARKFPRTGPFAELFKQVMGLLMLAAATYFAAGRLIHGPQFFWLVVFVIAITSLFLVARTVQLSKNARPVGIASTIAVTMLGGTLWWTAQITGLFSSAGGATSEFVEFTDDKFRQARDAGKPVLVKFTANWCSTCQVIEGTVFRDRAVWKALESRGFEVLKVDFSTSQEIPGHDLLLKLNPAGGIPLTAIYPAGRENPIVLSSVYNSTELLAALDSVDSTARAAAQ